MRKAIYLSKKLEPQAAATSKGGSGRDAGAVCAAAKIGETAVAAAGATVAIISNAAVGVMAPASV